ncbi:unnamed protein product [Symbiodinium natans]|uniref:Globin domain-containing protein n=1 Tax=Symbiodinium natans TaxID=878477 RepID=A0A812RXP3_9DINO|nr:unnamed protein product [Symbiodinium natans]
MSTGEIPKEAEDEEIIDVGVLSEVQEQTFEEMRLPDDIRDEAKESWEAFIQASRSRDAAGEAIYAALFDAAPSLQSLFKTPRSVMAMRFMNGLNSIMNALHTPTALKVMVETLGFQHLDLEVTVPRVVIFRDAIVDLFDMELGPRFTSRARAGIAAIMNYVGGAFIYIRREYAGRIRIITSSWRTANNKAADIQELQRATSPDGEDPPGEPAETVPGEALKNDVPATAEPGKDAANGVRASGEATRIQTNVQVPKTFNEMFLFNSAVMGFGNSLWMHLVLEQFDNMVSNVANSYRVQEECDILSLVLAQYEGPIILVEFKAVMLASLRSLVPKDWDSAHEVAWNWLWENIEHMLRALMGKPATQQHALDQFILGLSQDQLTFLRREIYKRFFTLAPAGQDYFKQSTTRLYWIADKVVEMTTDMFKDPKRLVEDISALGLRHVGYGIPTEFFAPFVSAAVDAVKTMEAQELAQDAFRWSLTLVSKILVRTILEGSTIVMKAINTNDAKQLRKAVSVAPRGKRAQELLNITVGTKSISPLIWSIESGSLITAKAMLEDLLVIRADRDNYYFGCDHLFERHPEIIQRLSFDAPQLLPTLLDGLIWRSRTTINGQRRVNYYVKHLIQDAEGNFNQALAWIVEGHDPKIICHDVVVLFSDLLWSGLAGHTFLLGRCYFLFTLAIFITGQSILQQIREDMQNQTDGERIAIFACRITIYVFSMGALLLNQLRRLIADIRDRNVVKLFGLLPFPQYLTNTMQIGNLALMLCLLLMCTQEPIFHCLGSSEEGFKDLIFHQHCQAGELRKEVYSTISMVAMLLYWALLLDLTIFSMRISAFTLVCGRVLSELGLFLSSLVFLIVTFSSSIAALNHSCVDFENIPTGALSLMEISLGMFPSQNFQAIQDEISVLLTVSLFIVVVIVFLLNLLVAQLNGAYASVYDDMVGYARLTRGGIIVSALDGVSANRWQRFLSSLLFEERLEFNEGDVGLAGGIQVTEPANEHPTTVENIRRFGGSTSPAMPWPEEVHGDEAEDKLDRLEKVILRATKKITSRSKKNGAGSSSMSGSQMSSTSDNESSGAGSE